MVFSGLIFVLYILSIFDVFIIKKKNGMILLVILLYTYVFARRGFISSDWIHYFPSFLSANNLFKFLETGVLNKLNFDYEIGYKFILVIFKTLTSNYDIYIFITTFLDILLLMYILKNLSPYPILSLFIFLIFKGIGIQIDLMRNFKSILFFLIGIIFLIKNERKKSCFFIILSYLVHRTGIIYLVLFVSKFLEKKSIRNMKIFFYFFPLGIIFYFFGNTILETIFKFISQILKNINIFGINGIVDKIEIYLENGLKKGALKIGVVEVWITFILFYFNRKKLAESKLGSIFLNIYVCYLVVYFYLNGIEVLHDRLEFLFIPSYWVLYPLLLKKLENRMKILIFIIISVIFLGKYTNYYKNTLSKPIYIYNSEVKNEKNYMKAYKKYLDYIRKQ